MPLGTTQVGAFDDDLVLEVERLADWLAHAYEKRSQTVG